MNTKFLHLQLEGYIWEKPEHPDFIRMIELSSKLKVRFALYDFFGTYANRPSRFTHTTVSGPLEDMVAFRLYWAEILQEMPYGRGSLKGVIEAGRFETKPAVPLIKIGSSPP